MTNIERTKLIDKYLACEMSPEEKIEFERLLLDPDVSYSNSKLTLREEIDIQKEIENAIRERGLREMLQKEEYHIRKRQRLQRIAIWTLSGGGLMTAIAAVILALVVVAPMAQVMQDYSSSYVSQITVGETRGGNEQAALLTNALVLMQQGSWDEASVIVDEVFEQTANTHSEQIAEIHNNAEWLRAICLMHDGKVIRANHLLQKIAKSDSYYRTQAIELLETL